MKQLTIFIFFALSYPSFACGNEYGYTLDGKRVFTQYFYLSDHHRSFNETYIRKAISNYTSKPDYSTNFKWQSNVALNYMKLGKLDSAETILSKLIIKHPEEYTINANLGTLYELKGDLQNALKYISNGYELNKDSHLGSEWIHVKILEAKIKEKNSPGWLSRNQIITVEELKVHSDMDRDFWRPNDLELQIRTRVPFTPAPNKVIANLMETLALFHEKYGLYENAILANAYQMEFDPSIRTKNKVNDRIKALNLKRSQANIKELPFMFKRMIKLQQIDPELLIIGLDEFEEGQQEMDELRIKFSDSLTSIRSEIDSLRITNKEPESNELNEKGASNSFLIASLSAIGGLILGLGIMFMRKQPK